MDRLVSARPTDNLMFIIVLFASILSQLVPFGSQFIMQLLNHMVTRVLLLAEERLCGHHVVIFPSDGRRSHIVIGLDVGVS